LGSRPRRRPPPGDEDDAEHREPAHAANYTD
jgi:hypothetical protein